MKHYTNEENDSNSSQKLPSIILNCQQNGLLDPTSFYENFKFNKGNISDYELLSKIGKGRYSEVFEGRNIKTNQNVIVKILRPIKKIKIKREVKILNFLINCPNIIKLSDIIKETQSQIYCLIFSPSGCVDFKKVIPNITDYDLRFYLYKILECLEYSHQNNIIHRDIKPGNIVVNPNTKELYIIDWGLSEFYVKNYNYNVGVSTRYFKAPELLLNYEKYNFAVDLWSFGCMFAGILFKKEYFFKGDSLPDQIIKISQILGAKGIQEFLETYKGECSISDRIWGKIKK